MKTALATISTILLCVVPGLSGVKADTAIYMIGDHNIAICLATAQIAHHSWPIVEKSKTKEEFDSFIALGASQMGKPYQAEAMHSAGETIWKYHETESASAVESRIFFDCIDEWRVARLSADREQVEVTKEQVEVTINLDAPLP